MTGISAGKALKYDYAIAIGKSRQLRHFGAIGDKKGHRQVP
jgi:hypothetical protein